jgi:hypothetical protein
MKAIHILVILCAALGATVLFLNLQGGRGRGRPACCCKWATNFLDAWMEMVQIMFDVSKRKFEKKPKKEKKKKKQKEARHSLKWVQSLLPLFLISKMPIEEGMTAREPLKPLDISFVIFMDSGEQVALYAFHMGSGS